MSMPLEGRVGIGEVALPESRPQATLLLPGPPQGTFLDVHSQISHAARNLPSSPLVSRIKSFQALISIQNEIGIQPSAPRIMRGPTGGIVLFHVSDNVGQLEENLKNNRLQLRPEVARPSWSSRCFGPALACHTDVATVKSMLAAQNRSPEDVLAIETFGMEKDYEVTVKQAYWDHLRKVAKKRIGQNQDLRSGLDKAVGSIQTPESEALIRNTILSDDAFNLSALVIDTYSALHPAVTRIIYRKAIQDKFGPFGYRIATDPKFLDKAVLLDTVDHMSRKYLHLSDTEEGKTRMIINEILKVIKTNPDLYTDSHFTPQGQAKSETDFESFVLEQLLMGGKIRDEITTRQSQYPDSGIAALLRLTDGWYPMGEPETKDVFKRTEGLGTDMGSNVIGVLREFDPQKHRILKSAEKDKFYYT